MHTVLDRRDAVRHLLAARGDALVTSGRGVFVLKVQAVNLPRSLPPRDAVAVTTRFRAVLGLDPI